MRDWIWYYASVNLNDYSQTTFILHQLDLTFASIYIRRFEILLLIVLSYNFVGFSIYGITERNKI